MKRFQSFEWSKDLTPVNAHLPLAAVDLEMLRGAETAVKGLSTRLDHEPLRACRREFERRPSTASKPVTTPSDIGEKELAQGAANLLPGKFELRHAPSDDRPRPAPRATSLPNWSRLSGASHSNCHSTASRGIRGVYDAFAASRPDVWRAATDDSARSRD